MAASITDKERAGAVEPYQDPALYDWEYRRRRHDVDFYRMLAHERGGDVLDLGCGTGRLTIPLLRDGHRVVGVDLSATMLHRAAKRLRRLARATAARATLVRGDLRALPVGRGFSLAVAAFHTVQHFVEDDDLVAVFRQVRRAIGPKGWFAFDVFFPEARWLSRSSNRRFDHTIFHHPVTGHRWEYSFSHRMDARRQALHMRFFYQRLSEGGRRLGRPQSVRLCHRQLRPDQVAALLRRSGLRLLSRWGGFKGEPLPATGDSPTEQHVYLAAAAR